KIYTTGNGRTVGEIDVKQYARNNVQHKHVKDMRKHITFCKLQVLPVPTTRD
ncbi:hypothetical protein J6590_107488, partial [Homalodisca vitripennis]